MNLPPLPPPPQDDDPIITQFKPVEDQWELTEDNINRIDPGSIGTILHNYYKRINTTPLEVYRYLIETKGCDINARDKYKNIPLLWALGYFDPNKGGDITVLMYLLSQNDVDAGIKDEDGYTILHRACININHLPLEIFKFLIETMGCDVNAQSTYNYIPLHHALRFFNPNDGGEITVLMYLLGHEAVNGNTKSRNGYTLLHIACENINYLPLEIFKVLIETKGCDINAQNTDDDTPLHYALPSFNTNNGIIALTYLLTKTNVNVNIKGHNGDTLLHFACKNINYLRLDVFKLLIETLGYDVNAQNTRNDTPLHYTLRFFNPNDGGDITVLTYLFTRKGIDPNIKGQYGHTLLHSACIKINNLPIDVFKFLIETMGFDINIRDDYGAIPLHCAFHGFDPNNDSNIIVLAYLINQNNFNVNIKDQEGCTFLHWACTWDTSDLNNVPDSEDDWNDLEAKLDTVLSHIAEIIAERCVTDF